MTTIKIILLWICMIYIITFFSKPIFAELERSYLEEAYIEEEGDSISFCAGRNIARESYDKINGAIRLFTCNIAIIFVLILIFYCYFMTKKYISVDLIDTVVEILEKLMKSLFYILVLLFSILIIISSV